MTDFLSIEQHIPLFPQGPIEFTPTGDRIGLMIVEQNQSKIIERYAVSCQQNMPHII